jgi:hypothetical protein
LIAALALGVGVAFIGWAFAELGNLRRAVDRLSAPPPRLSYVPPPPPTPEELEKMRIRNEEIAEKLFPPPTPEQLEQLHALPRDGHGWMIGPDGKARHIPDGP